MEIKAFDLDEAWRNCINACWFHGCVYTVDKGSFEGQKRLELSPVSLEVVYPGSRPLAPAVPVWATDVAPPTTNEAIEKYLAILASPTPPSARADYHYGEWLAPQIPIVIDFYKRWFEETGGYGTNRLCTRLGNSETVGLYAQPEAHTPCLVVVDTKIKTDQYTSYLEFFCYFRSWDLWGGFPVNLGGLQLLKEAMAEEIGVEDGKLFAYSKGLHLYEHVWPWVKRIVR